LECGTLAEPWSVKDQLFSLFFNIRLLDAHKGEDLALKPLRHILAGKDMLLYHTSQFSRGEEKMSSFFSYVGSLRIAWEKRKGKNLCVLLSSRIFMGTMWL
jgi:hypothetical protein